MNDFDITKECIEDEVNSLKPLNSYQNSNLKTFIDDCKEIGKCSDINRAVNIAFETQEIIESMLRNKESVFATLNNYLKVVKDQNIIAKIIEKKKEIIRNIEDMKNGYNTLISYIPDHDDLGLFQADVSDNQNINVFSHNVYYVKERMETFYHQLCSWNLDNVDVMLVLTCMIEELNGNESDKDTREARQIMKDFAPFLKEIDDQAKRRISNFLIMLYNDFIDGTQIKMFEYYWTTESNSSGARINSMNTKQVKEKKEYIVNDMIDDEESSDEQGHEYNEESSESSESDDDEIPIVYSREYSDTAFVFKWKNKDIIIQFSEKKYGAEALKQVLKQNNNLFEFVVYIGENQQQVYTNYESIEIHIPLDYNKPYFPYVIGYRSEYDLDFKELPIIIPIPVHHNNLYTVTYDNQYTNFETALFFIVKRK